MHIESLFWSLEALDATSIRVGGDLFHGAALHPGALGRADVHWMTSLLQEVTSHWGEEAAPGDELRLAYDQAYQLSRRSPGGAWQACPPWDALPAARQQRILALLAQVLDLLHPLLIL